MAWSRPFSRQFEMWWRTERSAPTGACFRAQRAGDKPPRYGWYVRIEHVGTSPGLVRTPARGELSWERLAQIRWIPAFAGMTDSAALALRSESAHVLSFYQSTIRPCLVDPRVLPARKMQGATLVQAVLVRGVAPLGSQQEVYQRILRFRRADTLERVDGFAAHVAVFVIQSVRERRRGLFRFVANPR